MMNFNDMNFSHITEEYLNEYKTNKLFKFISMIFKHCVLSGMFISLIMLMTLKEVNPVLIGATILNFILLVSVFFIYFGEEVEKVEEEIQILRAARDGKYNTQE